MVYCFSTSLWVQFHQWWLQLARECVYGGRWEGGQHEAEPQPQAEAETEAISEPEGEDMQVPHLAEHAAVDNTFPYEQI